MAYDNSIGKVVTENTNNVIKAGKEVIDGVGNAVSDFSVVLGRHSNDRRFSWTKIKL